MFLNFQRLIAKCTKETEKKWNNLRNDMERAKKKRISLNDTSNQIPNRPKSLKTKKRLKGSNGPCDLGPKQDQTKFE